MDAKLGREVLDVADYDKEHFDMQSWGRHESCGTVACLAGTTLLRCGYTLRNGYASRGRFGAASFHRPDGSRVERVGPEAAFLLGLSDDELVAGGCNSIWTDIYGGVERFRKLVEAAEKREAEEGTVL